MLEKVKKVMSVVFEIEDDQINELTSPDSVANWDSLRHINLVTSLEEEFDTRFTDEQISEMLNVKLIIQILKENLEG